MTALSDAPSRKPGRREASSERSRFSPLVVVALVTTACAGLVFFSYTRSALWLDEALTVNIARLPLSQLHGALKQDGAPPLFYVLLHLWTGVFGSGNVASRSLSGLFMAAAVVATWFAARRFVGTTGAWIAAVVMVANPYSIRYATEARMDSLELLLVALGIVTFQRAMDQPSLRKFEKEIREFRNKEAMIIDQRWNGGGNIEQELLAILVQREYEIWVPRGTEASGRPFAGYFGPKVVLQNWRSASNAEMFPAGFRALGLGKVIGTPTMGAVIGTGSYSLIDGSTVRTPGVGVYLADPKHTNMENYGVQPDIRVDNTPEDNLAGRDRQLETAVEELLKQLSGPKRNIASKEQQ